MKTDNKALAALRKELESWNTACLKAVSKGHGPPSEQKFGHLMAEYDHWRYEYNKELIARIAALESTPSSVLEALEAVEKRIRLRLNDEVNEHYHQDRKTYETFMDTAGVWRVINEEFSRALGDCPYCRGYPTPEESAANKESSCTCPEPCGAGGCPKASIKNAQRTASSEDGV